MLAAVRSVAMRAATPLVMWGVLSVAGLGVCSTPAAAQVVRLSVRDSTNGEAVARALVSVTDAGGTTFDGLTNEQGQVVLRLPRAGAWTVGVRRIGIAPRRIGPLQVDSGATVAVTIRTVSVRMRLPAVTVRADQRTCGRAPVGTDRAGILWEQITLALRSTVLARSDTTIGTLLRFTRLTRELDLNGVVRDSQIVAQGTAARRPFFAASADTLARFGYIVASPDGSRDYFGPDETVLLSESFARTHCFEAPPSDADGTLAELRFRPVPRRSLPDVAGTAFVDTLSGELRRIEFRYVASRDLLPTSARRAGGTVALRRLGDGRWIVHRWGIRAPAFSRHGAIDERPVHVGYRETGGVVDEMLAPPPMTPVPVPPLPPPSP